MTASGAIVRFEHELVCLPELGDVSFARIVPVLTRPGIWLGLDRSGRLHELNLPGQRSAVVGVIDSTALTLTAEVDVYSTSDGRLIAIAESYGRRALVVASSGGRTLMSLEREDHHLHACRFPLALFDFQGRSLLVHATFWNRLEISDPLTGRLLTARDSMRDEHGRRHEHALGYFHSRLTVSPNAESVLDDGWVWGSSSAPRLFSLRRWIEENPYESEDGPSVRDLPLGEHIEHPVCWVDENTVAIWGLEDDAGDIRRGVTLYDAASGQPVRVIEGPCEGLIFDRPYLVAWDRVEGASIWDLSTGERLSTDAAFCPETYHPGSQQFLTRVSGNEFRLSRRVGP